MSDELEQQALDVETQARQMGWVSEEEFKGDPEKWNDADIFVKRAETELPIALGTIRTLGRKLEKMERRTEQLNDTLEKFGEYHKTALDRETVRAAEEYQRGLNEAQAKMRQAVEEGDLEAFDAAKAKSDDLMKGATKLGDTPSQELPKVDPEVNRKWVEENPWFVKDIKMFRFAKECGDFLAMSQPTLKQKEQLAEIAKMVKEEFPDYFANPARKKPATVGRGDDTASPDNGKGKKGYNDLPAEAKAHCDQFVRDIKGFTKEKYLAQYRGPWK